MADNKTKIDRIHELLPGHLNSRNNKNWSGLIEAIGTQDELLAKLVADVRNQFFIKTSSRPYIDVLAANNSISRPKLVGMSDQSFRKYIPVLSYQPKQVKLIIDALLDIFFFKESTTAFLMSSAFQPFAFQDGWNLQLKIDGLFIEDITFNAVDFTDIANATADEIVAAYNRQSKYSYATNFYDSITKHNYIRIFTNTVGSKGSLEISGGLANIALELNGFISTAGMSSNTQWNVTKIGDTTTFKFIGGGSPGLNQLQVGDIFICNLPGNAGSFPITQVDIANNSITFTNLFSTVGTFSQTSANDTKYVRPSKYVVYKAVRRAVSWETKPGEITIETPTTPPVVQRSLKGSWHLNGVFNLMDNRNSNTSLTLKSAAGFPKSGSFFIEPVETITSRIMTTDLNEVVVSTLNGRLISNLIKYTYASRIFLSTIGTSTIDSNQITVADVTGLTLGMNIFMDGIREDAVINGINGNTITSSVAATKDLTGVVVEFGGNTLTGITPDLPLAGALGEFALSSLSRTAGIVSAATSIPHGYETDQIVVVYDSSGINILNTTGDTHTSLIVDGLASTAGIAPSQIVLGAGIAAGTNVLQVLSPTSISLTKPTTATASGVSLSFNENINGSYKIQTVTSPTTFTFKALGTNGTSIIPGTALVERIGLSNVDSKIILTTAISEANTRLQGAYVWDPAAPYVLSSATAKIQDPIVAGHIVRLLNISDNEIPNESGFLIFDYGKNTQEGPVKYLYKPADNVLALDPSYIFTQDHAVDSGVTMLSHKGPHAMQGLAAEYGPYVTNPSDARFILEQLIKSVASAGIFINFLVRYPEQLYGFFDCYNQSGNGMGAPFPD